MTPRQTTAWLALGGEDEKADASLQLGIAVLGSRGDAKDVKAQLSKWSTG